jgi:glycopeptide antibiotics resistance protein
MMINWSNFSGFFTTGVPSEVFYPSVIATAALLIFGLLWKGVKKKKDFILWVLLVEYVFIVVCSTIICRDRITFEFDRLEIIPFWTYKAVIEHTPGVSIWDIILNVVLFLPLGFLFKLLKPSISLLLMLGIAFCFSVFIESNQYFFEKGAVQIDDVMHNTIGCAIGWVLSYGILSINSRIKTQQ